MHSKHSQVFYELLSFLRLGALGPWPPSPKTLGRKAPHNFLPRRDAWATGFALQRLFGDFLGFDLFLGEAEAALPLAVSLQGRQEVVFPEVGPQGVGDVEFGVG